MPSARVVQCHVPTRPEIWNKNAIYLPFASEIFPIYFITNQSHVLFNYTDRPIARSTYSPFHSLPSAWYSTGKMTISKQQEATHCSPCLRLSLLLNRGAVDSFGSAQFERDHRIRQQHALHWLDRVLHASQRPEVVRHQPFLHYLRVCCRDGIGLWTMA